MNEKFYISYEPIFGGKWRAELYWPGGDVCTFVFRVEADTRADCKAQVCTKLDQLVKDAQEWDGDEE